MYHALKLIFQGLRIDFMLNTGTKKLISRISCENFTADSRMEPCLLNSMKFPNNVGNNDQNLDNSVSGSEAEKRDSNFI